MSGRSKFQISRSLDERIKRIIGGTAEYDTEFSQVSSAYILGFNYGNVTNCVGLTTNYQLQHAVFPVVGIVFFKTSPTDDDIKSSLKSIRDYSTSPNGLGSFKADKNEHLFLIYNVDKETHEIEKRIFNFTKGTFVRRKKLRLNVLNDPHNLRFNSVHGEDFFNLGDGDSLSSADDDQIDHLIFFIHGVGGVCDVRFRSCVEVVADFKKMANNLLAQQTSPPSSGETTPSNKQLAQHLKKGFFRKHSTDSTTSHGSDATELSKSIPSSRKPRRVECLPVFWHPLVRRETGLNDQLALLTLSSVPKLRHFLNKVVMDALLYSNGPVFTQTIMSTVGNEINRLYTMFMEKHPNFTGSVSLAGHSLGSVIMFDLLAHQIPVDNPVGDSPHTISADDGINNNNHEDISKQTMRVPNHVAAKDSNNCLDYKNLEELLKDMDLTRHAELFHKEHIDLNSLLLLTEHDMRELNLPLGARRKLGTYISRKRVTKVLSHGVQSQKVNNAQDQSTSSEKKDDVTHKNNNNNESNNNIPSNNLFNNVNTGQYLIEYPQLKFKPRCFFAFGSPMPMFLAVRGIQNISQEYKLPTCDRMFNIFHPYDPLAYRIEPLIDPRFKNVEPIQVPHHRGGKRMHVQLREGFARVGHDIKHRLLGSLRSTWSSFARFHTAAPDEPPAAVDETLESRRRLTKSASSSVDVEVESLDDVAIPAQRNPLKRQQELMKSPSDLNCLNSLIDDSIRGSLDANQSSLAPTPGEHATRPADVSESVASCESEASKSPGRIRTQSAPDDGHQPQQTQGGSEQAATSRQLDSMDDVEFDSSKVGNLNGGRRLDYVLQEKPIELFNDYIFAFTSHANYWANEDSALILLNEIYQADSIQIFDFFD